MRGFQWTLINDESVTSVAATPWMPKKSYAFFTTKNRSLSLAEVLQGGSFPREGIPYFYGCRSFYVWCASTNVVATL